MSSINIKIDKDTLICTVCYSDLCSVIFTCVNGPHYVCNNCNKNLKECPSCRNKDKLIRNIELEKNLKSYVVSCPKNCGEKYFDWNAKIHSEECESNPIKCRFCKRMVSSKCKDMINHFENFCDIKFDFLPICIKGNKIKCTTVQTPTIVIINQKFIIISIYKNDEYLLNVISDDSEFIGKKIKMNIINDKISSNCDLIINSGKNINKNIMNINKCLGNVFLFELPENKVKENKNNDEIFHFLNSLNSFLNS